MAVWNGKGPIPGPAPVRVFETEQKAWRHMAQRIYTRLGMDWLAGVCPESEGFYVVMVTGLANKEPRYFYLREDDALV